MPGPVGPGPSGVLGEGRNKVGNLLQESGADCSDYLIPECLEASRLPWDPQVVRPIFQRREETQGSKWLCPRERGCAAVQGCGVPSANLFTASGGLEPLCSVYLGFQS